MKIFAASEVICDTCNAQPGEICTYMYGQGSRRQKKFRFGAHAKRVRAAQAATDVFNALVDS